MPALNTIKYASLLTGYGYSPKVIEGEADYEQAKTALEGLLFPERKLSAEEDCMAKLLLHLIGLYESRTVVPPESKPADVLRHLMEQRQLKQADLIPVFGAVSIVSEVLRGKRALNLRHARKAADFFHVPVDLFV